MQLFFGPFVSFYVLRSCFHLYFPCLWTQIIKSSINIIIYIKDDIEAPFYVAAMMEMLFFYH
jgi:uncharacterized membrane protein YcfT